MIRCGIALAVLVLLVTAAVCDEQASAYRAGDAHAASWECLQGTSSFLANVPRRSADQNLSRGVFLVADPRITDPRFSQTVILLVEYDRAGALGLIVNRPTETRVSAILPDIEGFSGKSDTVRYGGPVSMHQVFILIRSARTRDMAKHIFRDVHYSTSRKLLEQLARGKEGERFLLYAGYAGWAGGQIENELRRGDWIVVPADAAIIFDREPAQVWHELIKRGPALQVKREDHFRFPVINVLGRAGPVGAADKCSLMSAAAPASP